MDEISFIRRTFQLALKGQGLTWPNPMVGAVIVKNNRIIAEGFHEKKGLPHAEIEALKNATQSPHGSTLYVNLEPCCHTNKTTPPCAQRLIQEGIKKVVISNLDPNPEVNGKGVNLLRSHGVEVVTGILEEEGERLNEVFFLHQRKKLPFIHFKVAVSLDGKTATKTGESQWITGIEARSHVHHLRSLHQAVVIGGETLRKDNPKLTVRLPEFRGKQPLRVIFTKSGNLPPNAHLLSDEKKDETLIYSQKKLPFDFPSHQVKIISSLQEALEDLSKKGIINLFLEAGPGLASEFFKENLIHRISLYQNPSFIGPGRDLFHDLAYGPLALRPKLYDIESQWLGQDHYLTGRLTCSLDSFKK